MQVFSIPMRTRFRGITVREGVLLRGEGGWGEWSPFLEYDAAVAAPWLRCAEEAAAGDWPEPVRAAVPVNVTVPAVDAEQAHAIVRAGGCRTAKVKVAEPGQTLADDEARLEAVRDALGPAGRVRVDANGAWDVDDAVTAIVALDRAAGGLEYVEQPCAAVEDLAVVRRRVDVPIAADESIRRAADPYRVRDLEAADIAVLKVQPLGGVRACLRIAEDIGLPVVVSSALETSVGIAAGVALAAALPELPYACGLATVQLLTDDVVTTPLLPVDGALPVLRPEVDEAALLPDRRRPGPGRPLGGPAGRACGRIPPRERVDAAWPGWCCRRSSTTGSPTSWSRPGPATHRCPSLPSTRPRRGWCVCTPASTSARAGFLALGLTKVGARAAVICTSGTAVANLHPAVLEAAHAGLPLCRRHRRPAGPAARHRRQPDHRPGRHLRPAGAHPRRCRCGLADRRSPAAPSTSTSSSTTRWSPTIAGRPRSTLRTGSRTRRQCRRRTRSRRARAPWWWPATTPGRRPGSSPSRRAGRCSPSPPAAPAPAPTRCAATGSCSTPTSASRIERVVVFGHPTLSRPVTRLLDRDGVEVLATPVAGVWSERPFPSTHDHGADRRGPTTRPGWRSGTQPTARWRDDSTRCSPPSPT